MLWILYSLCLVLSVPSPPTTVGPCRFLQEMKSVIVFQKSLKYSWDYKHVSVLQPTLSSLCSPLLSSQLTVEKLTSFWLIFMFNSILWGAIKYIQNKGFYCFTSPFNFDKMIIVTKTYTALVQTVRGQIWFN